MAKVAVVRSWYLPISETFIYSELVNLRNITPIVCAKKIMNIEQFPFQSIYLFRNFKDLEGILRKQNVDLIHVRFGTTAAEILNVKKKLGLPMLTSFHGFDLPSNRQNQDIYRGKLHRLFEEGEAFTVTSNNMKEILIRYGCPKQKILVHHSGIDLEQFTFAKRKMPEDGKVILLSVGRLVEKKRMDCLVKAYHLVQKKYPSVQLRIVGDGPHRDKLRGQVKRLGLRDKVKFLGALAHDKVVQEMQQAHLFALASASGKNGNQEGIPNVLKEAMASGLPVVSTMHAGIPELVRHGKSGLLVPEKDVQALAGSLFELIQNPDKWGKMGKKGRKKVMLSFNAEKQIDELEDIYTRNERSEKNIMDTPAFSASSA